MAISPSGDRIYVTARNSNGVIAFDTAKLIDDPANARMGMATVGSAPVPLAVIDGGKSVIVGNSNRFAANSSTPQTLTVLDASKIPSGGDAVRGSVEAGAFPREMRLSADQNTLFVTNFLSSSLQVIDLKRMPLHAK
jgi:DNA-binding beta-propeller fold protein YncE